MHKPSLAAVADRRLGSHVQVLAGKHMVPPGSVRVLGQPPFHATALTSSGELSYIGGSWDRDIAFAGYSIPLQARQAGGGSRMSLRSGVSAPVCTGEALWHLDQCTMHSGARSAQSAEDD